MHNSGFLVCSTVFPAITCRVLIAIAYTIRNWILFSHCISFASVMQYFSLVPWSMLNQGGCNGLDTEKENVKGTEHSGRNYHGNASIREAKRCFKIKMNLKKQVRWTSVVQYKPNCGDILCWKLSSWIKNSWPTYNRQSQLDTRTAHEIKFNSTERRTSHNHQTVQVSLLCISQKVRELRIILIFSFNTM
jgi:hypothetical protein